MINTLTPPLIQLEGPGTVTTREPSTSRGFELSPRNIVAVVLVLIAALFIAQNRNSVSIDLFWISVRAPLWIILVVFFAAGWVTGLLTSRRSKKD